MNKGTKVRLIDGSYSIRIAEGQLMATGNIISGCEYEIVETGLKLPADNRLSKNTNWNDTILRNLKTNELVFTQIRFAREIPQPVYFMEAVKAFSEGKAIRCEGLSGFTYIYKRCCGDYFRDTNGSAPCVGEILEGTWYVEDSYE